MDRTETPGIPESAGTVPGWETLPVVAPPVIASQGVKAAAAGEELAALPLRWRELVALVLVVVLADVTVYRGLGFSGYAALFLAAPLLLILGSPRPRWSTGLAVTVGMLWLVAARLVWLGSGWTVAVAVVLLVVSALATAGYSPQVLSVPGFAFQAVVAGAAGLAHYRRNVSRLSPVAGYNLLSWNVVLPVVAIGLFGTVFILANPDLVTSLVDLAGRTFDLLEDWLLHRFPSWQEIVFWGMVAWGTIGLIRPLARKTYTWSTSTAEARPLPESREATLYVACRNTLVALVALFAVYLVFEFKTLWFRVFPKGFYYAGYAHEGAAWLTVALALTTVTLSLMFRGAMLRDPRLPRLRRLAWVWSAQNLILAAAVYHRLAIYIQFNGMTQLRTVALFGITSVVAGVVLVVWKILYSRDFTWLVHRQASTVALAAYLFVLTPVDGMVHGYNAQRVLEGDLAPSVQMSVHPIDAEGLLALRSAADCEDKIIREGIRAMFAQRAVELLDAAAAPRSGDWTAFQGAQAHLLTELEAMRGAWKVYLDPAKRTAALKQFHEYVYQWY